MTFRPALGAIAAIAASLPAFAHGGQYRPPILPVMRPPSGAPFATPTPGTPGPSTPGASTPSTTPGPTISEEGSWQVWWEFNKDPFVQQDLSRRLGPATGSDDFYLGRRKSEAPVDTLLATDVDLRDRVVPALAALMDKERNRDVQTACMMALGKIGMDAPGVDLETVLAARIARDDQEVRETAVLALGLAGRSKALPLLLALLRDDAEGRRLCERESVGDRTRAFAAYGLGMWAHRANDGDAKQRIHDALWAVLRTKDEKSRDLRTAAVNALGLLCDPEASANKRLAWVTVEELLDWYQEDLGRGDEAIQAQAPVAIGRLLGRGTSQIHQRCKQQFAATLLASAHRSNAILESAAIGLGMLAVPAAATAASEDGAAAKALQTYFDKGFDRPARNFAIMAMGRIGGAEHREWLLDAYRRGNKTMERPWIALALGLIAAQSAQAGQRDVELAKILLDDAVTTPRPEVRGALAIAAGLTRSPEAVEPMKRLLRDSEHDETLAGYCCVALALLGDNSAVQPLLEILERSKRRPFLLLQAAVGLGRLGDRTANERLVAMMKESESVAVLAALASAIGQIGDRRAIEPLLGMTRNDELTKLARAFCAAALGGIGDRSTMPWNYPLSRDCNYGAPVDTLSNGATGVLDIL